MAKPVRKPAVPVLVVYNIPTPSQINEKTKEKVTKACDVAQSLENVFSK